MSAEKCDLVYNSSTFEITHHLNICSILYNVFRSVTTLMIGRGDFEKIKYLKKVFKCFNIRVIICIVLDYLIIFDAIFLWVLVNTNVCCWGFLKKMCVCVLVCVCVCGWCVSVLRPLFLIQILTLSKDGNKKVCAFDSDCWTMKGTTTTYKEIGWLKGWRKPLFTNKRWLQIAVKWIKNGFVIYLGLSI